MCASVCVRAHIKQEGSTSAGYTLVLWTETHVMLGVGGQTRDVGERRSVMWKGLTLS